VFSLWLVLFALAYLAAALLGCLDAADPPRLAAYWPCGGLYLAALLRTPWQRWPAVVATALGVHLLLQFPQPALGLSLGLGKSLEALLGAWVLQRWFGRDYAIANLREVVGLVLVAAPLGTAASATCNTVTLALVRGDELAGRWLIEWVGAFLGILVVAPVLLAAGPGYSGWRRRLEAIGLGAGLAATCLFFFSFSVDSLFARPYPVLPFLVWAALRFGLRGAALANLVHTVVGVGYGARGYGPFAVLTETPGAPLLALQLYLIVICASFLMMAAVMSERLAREREVREALVEKETLLKEVHHRVKNNLAVIMSLLNLQAAKAHDPTTRELLRESQNRVRSMAIVHETLYQSRHLSHVEVKPYIEQLCRHLLSSYGLASGRIDFQHDIAPLSLNLDRAIPFGLILNELVSNALKHAFPEGRAGWLRVELGPEKTGEAVLVVKDNGVGLPADIDLFRTRSLGLRLIANLTRQLDGILEVQRQGGTTFRITFTLQPISYKPEAPARGTNPPEAPARGTNPPEAPAPIQARSASEGKEIGHS